MTREHVSEKLRASGETGAVAGLHARHYLSVFEEAAPARAEIVPRSGCTATVQRSATFGRLSIGRRPESGDTALAVALTVASVPLWYRLCLIDEALDRVRSALAEVERQATPDPRARMHLYAALGWPQMRASSDLPSGGAAWRKVLALAEELGDTDFQLRALWALWLDQTNKGRLREALETAGTFKSEPPRRTSRTTPLSASVWPPGPCTFWVTRHPPSPLSSLCSTAIRSPKVGPI
jgi:hypothetical protein